MALFSFISSHLSLGFPGLRTLGLINQLNYHLNLSLKFSTTPISHILSDTSLPKITIPNITLTRLAKSKRRKQLRSKKSIKKIIPQSSKRVTIISCKRKEFNHFRGTMYTELTKSELASGGWKHKKSRGDFFTINNYKSNPALQNTNDVVSFESLNLTSKLLKAIYSSGIKVPTVIQALGIPKILKSENTLCVAETGSGKTLAYLIPLIQQISLHSSKNSNQTLNSPKSIIIAPNRELVMQIYEVCQTICSDLNFKVAQFCGGNSVQKLLRNPPQLQMDILVSTPGVLSKLLTNRIIVSNKLLHIVIDEADTMLDDSFAPITLRLLNKLKLAHFTASSDSLLDSIKLILVGATIPKRLNEILDDVVPVSSFEKVFTRSVHCLLPHVTQKFLRLHSLDKAQTLINHLKINASKNIPTAVFCNKAPTVIFLTHLLKENNISHVMLHASMSNDNRQHRYDNFKSGCSPVLLSTDVSSRGLDTSNLREIINFNFPQVMSDYIHRCGRVGRVGSSHTCMVTNYVTHRWDVDLLWKIEAAARKAVQLDRVNANIKRQLKLRDEKRISHE